MNPVQPEIIRGNRALWAGSSFGAAAPEVLRAHLQRKRYGDFLLTGAIRPSLSLAVVPRAGYRIGHYQDETTGQALPTVSVSASAEYLFDLFLSLIALVGEEVAVVLESSHDPTIDGHVDLVRDQIENVVLRSILIDFEDLIVNDGYTGVAVLNADGPVEVQLDEHKLLFVYAPNIGPYVDVIRTYGVPHDPELRLISEAEHLHLSAPEYADAFELLRTRLAVD